MAKSLSKGFPCWAFERRRCRRMRSPACIFWSSCSSPLCSRSNSRLLGDRILRTRVSNSLFSFRVTSSIPAEGTEERRPSASSKPVRLGEDSKTFRSRKAKAGSDKPMARVNKSAKVRGKKDGRFMDWGFVASSLPRGRGQNQRKSELNLLLNARADKEKVGDEYGGQEGGEPGDLL